MKQESENVGLKLNIQKTKIMASGPITSWEIGGETVETVSDVIFGGSKITADGDCSHEIKRHVLLRMKVLTNLDRILKSRDIANKGPSSKGLFFFSVVMYGCESWIQDAWGWCTGMIQRDDMGWELGGGSRLGTHVHPWLIHVKVWQNQYSIVQ